MPTAGASCEVPSEPSTDQAAASALRRLLPVSSSVPSPSPPPLDPAATATQRMPGSDPSSSPTMGASPPAPGSGPPPRRRRQATTAACGACRKRKSRCNGERPQCSVCHDRGTECEYATKAAETHTQALKRRFGELQSEKTAYEQLYDALRTRSLPEAKDVLQRIRGGADACSILRHVNYGDVLVQMSVVPESRYHYEFPYRKDMPAFLMRANNPYLDSQIYEYSLRGDHDRRRLRLTGPDSDLVSSPHAEPMQLDPYVKPFHAATIIHPWLEAAKPSKWTDVCADDAFMRKILHEYFIHDYEWFTFFHKDYFLQDLANQRPRFCSRVLVNAVLCLGSYSHRGLKNRANYWDPKNITYQFLAEAKRLFEYELDIPRPEGSLHDTSYVRRLEKWEERMLTTIQTCMVLGSIYAYNGADRLGWRYISRSVEMGYDLGLFGQPREGMAPESKNVFEFTAWCVFMWQSLNCYHYFRQPLCSGPPQSALPDTLEHPQWYGETWLRYPASTMRLTTNFPFLFKAKAELWALMNEYSAYAFGRENPRNPLHPSDTLWYYKRLVSWLESLPEPLSPKKIVFPHQIMVHMQYNNFLISLLKPIGMQRWDDGTGVLQTESPHEAYLNASIRLETLVRLYYLRHGFEALNSFIVQFCASLCQMTIDTINADEGYLDMEHLKSTVLLAAKALYDQSSNYYLAKVVFRIQLNAMREEEKQMLRHYVVIDAEEAIDQPLSQPFQSDWPAFARSYHEDRKSLSSLVESMELESPTSPTSSHSSG